jgi:membrane-bound metal-dependent hydrolase YbcI (DUF457 family)
MTVYEHTMIGVNGALAAGLHRRHGWQIVALAGIAAVLPDLDGMTILLGPTLYADGHRLWCHNLLIAGLVAVIVSAIAYQTNALTGMYRWLAKRWAALSINGDATELPPHRLRELVLWIVVGVLAAYSHLLMDVFFSGGKNLQTWGVSLFWPFSRNEWTYPLLPWGNIGATVILAISMFLMLRWPVWIRTIAASSLVVVGLYMAYCGMYSHVGQHSSAARAGVRACCRITVKNRGMCRKATIPPDRIDDREASSDWTYMNIDTFDATF